MKKGATVAAGAAGLGTTGAGLALPGREAAGKTNAEEATPNVLVILVDQLRHDAFSFRGNRMINTPNIDRLAAEGTTLTQATCSSPVCGPSRAALLSGAFSYDNTYVMRNRGMEEEGVWQKDITTVDEALTRAGYQARYHGKWHVGNGHLSCYEGTENMFDHEITDYTAYLKARYDKPPDDSAHKFDDYTNWRYRYWQIDELIEKAHRENVHVVHSNQAGTFDIASEDTLTAWTAQDTVDFLASQPEEPFSATCSILHPHGPVIPNEAYASMFAPANMPMPKNMYGVFAPQRRRGRPAPIPESIPPSEDGLGQFIALYYALVKEVDDWVGRILDALDEAGLTDNTLVAFTADHGELMGSHNSLGKGQFFEEAFRVPLIFRYPGVVPESQRVDAPASGVDVAPTILDYCGVEPLPQFHGSSLRGVMEGGEPDDRYAYGEYREGKRYQRCLRSTAWKYVDRPGKQNLLFDLRSDPYEMHNLLAGEPMSPATRDRRDYLAHKLDAEYTSR